MTTVALLVENMLAGNSGVTALVSTRIYPLNLPQTPTYPALTYQRISAPARSGSTTFRQQRFQVNCWAATYGAAQELAAAVIAASEDYTDGGQTPAIKGVFSANMLDDFDADTKDFRVIVDLMISTTGD